MSQGSDPYEALATEYYDPTLHPTCANFRQATDRILREWLNGHPVVGHAVDIGCGDSLLASVIQELRQSPSRLSLIDVSPSMLAHSERWRRPNVGLVVGSAQSMPLDASCIDFLLASLGDPYNGRLFWREVSRVLRAGATAFYTCPSWVWAESYRATEGSPANGALFVLADGRQLLTPSVVLTPRAQVAMINSAGLRIQARGAVRRRELPPTAVVSPKLNVLEDHDAAIVDWYVALKPVDADSRARGR